MEIKAKMKMVKMMVVKKVKRKREKLS